MAGMRRSEVSALRWADVDDAADGEGVLLVTVRRGKTNQEGETTDVRSVKGGGARVERPARQPAPGRVWNSAAFGSSSPAASTCSSRVDDARWWAGTSCRRPPFSWSLSHPRLPCPK